MTRKEFYAIQRECGIKPTVPPTKEQRVLFARLAHSLITKTRPSSEIKFVWTPRTY